MRVQNEIRILNDNLKSLLSRLQPATFLHFISGAELWLISESS